MKWGLSLEEAARLHGHLGPWLAIGYRAGSIARRELEPRDPREVLCIARIPAEIPYTCSLDGLQASIGCTAGKLNLVLENSSDFEYVFIHRGSGRRIVLKLRREVIEALKSVKSLEEGARYVEVLEPWELFELSS